MEGILRASLRKLKALHACMATAAVDRVRNTTYRYRFLEKLTLVQVDIGSLQFLVSTFDFDNF